LSMDYAKERRELINSKKALSSAAPGMPMGKDTVYFATMDQKGNSASFINSIY